MRDRVGLVFGCYNSNGWWGAEVLNVRVVLELDLFNLSVMGFIDNKVTWTMKGS